ncbi:hypothetical protein [Sorangium cellulosum]|uniref:hypothetical protein n=1 Tax=Sorangium cellulosum TaxID=56 RepID=UPI00077959C2|nr:hypothetical protein [Sorangium cellulosum]
MPLGAQTTRPPHPATVAQKKEAPAKRQKPPHPATVAQKKEAPAKRQKPPHPATVAQRKDARAEETAPGGGAVQRMEEDKYDRQNRIAASALGVAAGKRTNNHGNKVVTLASLVSSDVVEKLALYSSTKAETLLYRTIVAPAQINELNGDIVELSRKGSKLIGSFASLNVNAKESEAAIYYQYLGSKVEELGLQLREPHVNAAGGMVDNGSMDVAMANNTDPVKWAWYSYARNTPSSGWEKMTGLKRPHTPQFAEIGLGGFVPRIVYDWYNDVYYATPHYNVVIGKGLVNAYVELSGANTWTTKAIYNAGAGKFW